MIDLCVPQTASLVLTVTLQESDDSARDYVGRMRKSLDEMREYYPHDSRKNNELRPSIDQYRPSVEYRKSLEVRLPARPPQRRVIVSPS